jgi:hypothetical protein
MDIYYLKRFASPLDPFCERFLKGYLATIQYRHAVAVYQTLRATCAVDSSLLGSDAVL